MTPCLFCSDLHGRPDRYEKLFQEIESQRPAGVFLGGDLLPGLLAAFGTGEEEGDFVGDLLVAGFERLRERLGDDYPRVFLILGNDDLRSVEAVLKDVEARGLWSYAHGRRLELRGFDVYGYSFVPPTPFLLKDWERYDVSRYVDPGCVSPEEGRRSVAGRPRRGEAGDDPEGPRASCRRPRSVAGGVPVPHAARTGRSSTGPPWTARWWTTCPSTSTWAASRCGGSSRRASRCLTLHGHVHESARLTGSWQDRIGRT